MLYVCFFVLLPCIALACESPFEEHANNTSAIYQRMESLYSPAPSPTTCRKLYTQHKRALSSQTCSSHAKKEPVACARHEDAAVAADYKTHFYVAYYARLLGKRNEAHGHYEKALLLSLNADDRAFSAIIYNDRAHMFKNMRDDKSAKEDALRALWLAPSANYAERMYIFLTLADISPPYQAKCYLFQAERHARHVINRPHLCEHYTCAKDILAYIALHKDTFPPPPPQ